MHDRQCRTPASDPIWVWLFAAFIAACIVCLLAFGFARGHLKTSALWPARWQLVAPIERVVCA